MKNKNLDMMEKDINITIKEKEVTSLTDKNLLALLVDRKLELQKFNNFVFVCRLCTVNDKNLDKHSMVG